MALQVQGCGSKLRSAKIVFVFFGRGGGFAVRIPISTVVLGVVGV